MISSGLSIKWIKGGAAVTEDSTRPVYVVNATANGTSILMFRSLQRSQTGLYACVASNNMGMSSSSVSIYGPPDNVANVSFSVDRGMVTLSWTPPASGPFTISYVVHYGLVNASLTSVDTTTSTIQLSGLQGRYVAYVVTVGKTLSTTVQSEPSEMVQFYVPSVDSTTSSAITNGTIAGAIVVFVLIGIAVMCFMTFCYIQRQKTHQMNNNAWVCDEIDQGCSAIELVPPISLPSNIDIPGSLREHDCLSNGYEVDPKWEYPREALQFSEMIHEGSSMVLYKGVAIGIKGEKPIEVAIKLRKQSASEDDVRASLFADMEYLASLGSHPNIVGLLRVCTVESPVCMILEYMCHGDLLGFLRASRGHHGMYTVFPCSDDDIPQVNLTSRDLMSIAAKIASGMAFLAERKVVHGSLCASNVLVGTSLDIKINLRGYELSRDSVWKWMSPETLFDGILNTSCDIWSFGVTLWEIVTVGGTPYAEILAEDLYQQLCNGLRLPCPSHCAQEVYDVMKACWDVEPLRRLSFDHLQARLDALSNSVLLDFGQYDNQQYSQFNDNSLTTLL